MHRVRLAIAAISLLMPAGVDAQDTARRVNERPLRPLQEIAQGLQRPLARVQWRSGSLTSADQIVLPPMFRQTSAQNASPRRRSSTRTILGAVAGATGGFFAGGFTGAWIEGDRCNCDDPGFKGFLIGAPVGAVAGGILGGLYLF